MRRMARSTGCGGRTPSEITPLPLISSSRSPMESEATVLLGPMSSRRTTPRNTMVCFSWFMLMMRSASTTRLPLARTAITRPDKFVGKIENLTVSVQRRARVILNERTGTIVMGKDVRLGAVSILHGGFSVQISTEYSVSQPLPLSSGKTEIVAETDVKAKDSPARRLEIGE